MGALSLDLLESCYTLLVTCKTDAVRESLLGEAYLTWAYKMPVPFGSVQKTLCTSPTSTSLPPERMTQGLSAGDMTSYTSAAAV